MIRALALALWGTVLLQSYASGRLDLLLRGLFHPLVACSGLVLVALALQQGLTSVRCTTGRLSNGQRAIPWPWLLSAAMAIAVLALPPNPSFSLLAASRPTDLAMEGELSFLLPPAKRSLTDWVRLLRSQPDPDLYAGDPVQISGFVLSIPGEPPQLGRLLVRCCLADATPAGLPVRWPRGFTPKADHWLELQGRMGVEPWKGQNRSVVIAESVRPIPRPRRPLEP